MIYFAYMYNNFVPILHVIYVTWAGGICLICTHKPEGTQYPRENVDISGKF